MNHRLLVIARLGIVALGLVLGHHRAHAWDAGPDTCKHKECSDTQTAQDVIDTQPRYLQTKPFISSCPAGEEEYASACYGTCPSGMNRTALCSCANPGTLVTDCDKYGPGKSCPSGYNKTAICTCEPRSTTDCETYGMKHAIQLSCPADTDAYAAACYYDRCPARSTRTAISTCAHQVRWRGNTHLYIANRAIELLAASSDPTAKKVAATLNDATCRDKWEQGLWDGDGPDLQEQSTKTNQRGTHFYNGAGKDWLGKATSVVTYAISGVEQKEAGNARTNAAARLTKASMLTTPDQCWELGVALHYLTDATQPMHTSGFDALQVPLMLHAVFEEYVPTVQARATLDQLTFTPPQSTTADTIFGDTAKASNALAPPLVEALLGRKDGTWCSMTPEGGITYTGNCFVNDPTVDAKIAAALRAAFLATASYLYVAVPIYVAPAGGATIDTTYWYQLTNNHLGKTRALDTYSNGTNALFMATANTGKTGQRWKLTLLPDGTYRLTNSFLGDTRPLDTAGNGANAPFMSTGTRDTTGTHWTLVPFGDGTYRLMNNFLGARRALDTGGSPPNAPFMGTSLRNNSGQHWTLTKFKKI